VGWCIPHRAGTGHRPIRDRQRAPHGASQRVLTLLDEDRELLLGTLGTSALALAVLLEHYSCVPLGGHAPHLLLLDHALANRLVARGFDEGRDDLAWWRSL
jgi:hypothetical protein